jgi:hypothetical protein
MGIHKSTLQVDRVGYTSVSTDQQLFFGAVQPGLDFHGRWFLIWPG